MLLCTFQTGPVNKTLFGERSQIAQTAGYKLSPRCPQDGFTIILAFTCLAGSGSEERRTKWLDEGKQREGGAVSNQSRHCAEPQGELLL